MNGNATVVRWIIAKWKELGKEIGVNDKSVSTKKPPLFMCCYKGYNGSEGIKAKLSLTKKKRFETAQTLIENGADVNWIDPITGQTALHWAAYHDDVNLVNLLLQNKAKICISQNDFTPIDIAGFCDNVATVKAFCLNMEAKIEARQQKSKAGEENKNEEETDILTTFDPQIKALADGFSNIGNLFFNKKKGKIEKI